MLEFLTCTIISLESTSCSISSSRDRLVYHWGGKKAIKQFCVHSQFFFFFNPRIDFFWAVKGRKMEDQICLNLPFQSSSLSEVAHGLQVGSDRHFSQFTFSDSSAREGGRETLTPANNPWFTLSKPEGGAFKYISHELQLKMKVQKTLTCCHLLLSNADVWSPT